MNSYELSSQVGYMTHAEIDCLKSLVKDIHPMAAPEYGIPVFVNIGAGPGVSTLAMLEGNPNATVFSIDIFAGEMPSEATEHVHLREIDPTMSKRTVRIWGDSKKVGDAWPFKADLVLVDGDHSHGGVWRDILSWHTKIRWGGILAFHDYGVNANDGSEQWPGVRMVVDEFAGKLQLKQIAHVGMLIAFEVYEER